MNVCVLIRFESLGEKELESMRRLARSLTKEPASVNVSPDDKPGWLLAEFTMPTEPQYKAVPKIDHAIDLHLWASNKLDSIIGFPKSEAERAHTRRKAERRRERRRRAM